MKTILSKFNFPSFAKATAGRGKVGMISGLSLFFALAIIAFAAPRVSTVTYADGCGTYANPVFNPFPVTWGNLAGNDSPGVSCNDFALISGNVTSANAYAPSFSAKAGDNIQMRIYVHNGAASNSGAVMHNVQVNTNIDYNSGQITTTASASNAASISGNVSIALAPNTHLVLVSGNPSPSIGDMNACFEFSQQFYFTLQVVANAPTGNNTITATPGSQIGSQCLYTGNVQWTNSSDVTSVEVTVKDVTQNSSTNSITGTGGTPNSNSSTDWLFPGDTYQYIMYNTTGGQHSQIAQTTEAVPTLNCGAAPTPTPTPTVVPTQQNFNFSITPTSFCSTQVPTFLVTNATSGLLGKSIYWSSTFNGNSTGENLDYYGDSIDGSGNYNEQAAAGSYLNYVGNWTKTITVYAGPGLTNPVSRTVNFTVNNCATPTPTPTPTQQNFNFSITPTSFCSTQVPTFLVTNATSGLFGKSIYWSSTFNGASTGENLDYYGDSIDGSGNYNEQATAGSYLNYVGNWTKTITVYAGPGLTNPVSRTVNFTVNNCSTPTPTPTPTPNLFCPANVPVILNPSIITVGQTSNVSAPAGWSNGNFSSDRGSVAAISQSVRGIVATGFSAGTANISGFGFTAPNGAINCSLSPAPLTVNAAVVTPTQVTATATATASATAYASCPNGTTASATASASATATATANDLASAQQAAHDAAFSQAQAQAYAQAQAQVTCSVTPTPTPTPSQNGVINLTKTVKNISGGDTSFSHSTVAKQGDTLQYQISVSAGTSVNLNNVVVTDTFASGLNYVANSLQVNGQSHASGLSTGGLTFASVNQSAILITYQATVSAASGNIVNTAQARADNSSNSPTDQAVVTVNFVQAGQPSLAITKQVEDITQSTGYSSAVNANKGDSIQYQVVIKNIGSATANNVFFSDSNPIGVQPLGNLQTSIAAQGNIATGLSFGNLNAGASITLTYGGTVNISGGTIINVATVSADNTASQNARANVNVFVPIPSPTPTPVSTGNCNNSSNSCNNNTNNNNSTNNNSNNSSNQNNNNNINGNNNNVTNTNNNCVNNSCNTTYNPTVYINTAGTPVPFNQFSQLSLTKGVRNINGGTFQNSISSNNGQTVQFEIVVSNSGNATANNVRVTDSLPNGLNLVSGSVQVNGSNVSDSNLYNGMYVGNLTAGQQERIDFQAIVNSGNSASIQNNASASSDNAGSAQASAWVFVNGNNVPNSNVNLTYSKSAVNNTKNADAQSVVASREDFITYTLTVTNSGNSPANNFIITDDLSQVMPYADISDYGGGSMNGNAISYPGITVPAGGSVSRSFKVRVKYALASNLSYVMSNTYGNTVTIHINTPQVVPYTAPTTGADSNALIFGGMLTAGFAVFKKKGNLLKLIFT